MISKRHFIALTMMFLSCVNYSFSQNRIDQKFQDRLEKETLKYMEKGDIPGLSLIVIDGDQEYIRNFGYTDINTQQEVSDKTLFEIGSCTKAFTALALTRLEDEGKVDLDKNVSYYLPWFKTHFEDSAVHITVRQLLHHTSGIPWTTISKIPASNADDALEVAIKSLIGQELKELPGDEYEYATINYDVIALIIQTITGESFETYLQKNIIDELGMVNTTIGIPKDESLMSTGHKIGFFSARPYEAPVYKGNNAAGYVISDARDMAKWLRFQLSMSEDNGLNHLVKVSHDRDETVALHGMAGYARGWEVVLDGTGEINHEGLNPNFTAYVTFRPKEKMAVAVLANSNSTFTTTVGNKAMKLLAKEKIEKEYDPGDRGDKVYAGASIAISLYVLVVLSILGLMVYDIIKGKRKYEPLTSKKAQTFLKAVFYISPCLLGLYILPTAIADFTWENILVWTPISFGALLVTILAAVTMSYIVFVAGLLFPEKNAYKKKIPQVLLMTIISGLANVFVVVMVTSAIDSDVELKYLIFYYLLIIGVYLLGRRFVQINLINITQGLVYDLRVKLITKFFSTSYERFEGMDRGRIYTSLNDDVNTIGGSTNLFITLVTSMITGIGAFLYLASLAFWATVLSILMIVIISTLYYLVSQSTNKYFEQARDSRDVFMRLINGMIDGYKEISLHHRKKIEYKDDVGASANTYKEKTATSEVKFTNAFLVGESFLVVLLGFVSIGMAELFPNIQLYTILSFVIVFLYLIGPVNSILGAIPSLMQLRIAWDRVQKFMKEIPANLDLNETPKVIKAGKYQLEAREIEFQYKSFDANSNGFKIGPINLEMRSGQILFVVGGNGSGKTTLAKMLTGLYKPTSGYIFVNDVLQENYELSEYFSTVFNPSHLFHKLYDLDLSDRKDETDKYLKRLDLDEKVTITDNEYNTIDLSGGQRKRLALLQCYLEDYPIYLFDEWAADQDPEYRKFFYRTLLPEMKQMGKMVIAITHDDHYFDVADRVMKMEQGQLIDITAYHEKEGTALPVF